jgi:hypothetical protein
MGKNERRKKIAQGLTLPGALFFDHSKGGSNRALRDEMKAAGASYDSKAVMWVFPDRKTLDRYAAKVGAKGNGSSAKPVQQPLPPVKVTPEPEKVETKVVPKPPAVKPEPKPVPVSGAPLPPQVDPAPEIDLKDKSLLELKPSRFVAINIKVKSPNFQKELKREKKESKEHGEGAVVVRKETEHYIIDEEEEDKAKSIKSACSTMLRGLGEIIQDGVRAIPLENEVEWDERRAKAKAMAREFNKTSRFYKVIVNAIKLAAMVGEEEMMARKIAYEIQCALNDAKEAMDSYDAERIRTAATEMKAKAKTLQPGIQQGSLLAAEAAARDYANKVAAELRDKGELVQSVKNRLDSSAVDSARMMFLDLAVPEEVEDVAGINAGRFASLDTGNEESGDGPTPGVSAGRFAEL